MVISGPGRLRSGILPGGPGKIPDLAQRDPEKHQDILVIFRTSLAEVRNITNEVRENTKNSGNIFRRLRSGILPVLLVVSHTSLVVSQTSLVIFRTSKVTFRTSLVIFRTSNFPLGHIPDLAQRGPESYQYVLVRFWTSHNEVRNVAKSKM